MSLSPWDLGADISFDFSLYRPRRASYVYATRASRGQRNESYRHATKHSSTGASVSSAGGGVPDDDVERRSSGGDSVGGGGRRPFGRKKRAESYRAAMKPRGSSEPPPLPEMQLSEVDEKTNADFQNEDDEVYDDDGAAKISRQSSMSSNAIAGGDEDQNSTPMVTGRRCTKNLVALSIGFVLIFSAFRALQNLASSLHGPRLGSAALACVHGMALAVGLLAPFVVGKVGPRWAIVMGAIGYPVWIAANLCVTGECFTASGLWPKAARVAALITASLIVGIGQSVAWSSQVRCPVTTFDWTSASHVLAGKFFASLPSGLGKMS
jgi:hypothetical protein